MFKKLLTLVILSLFICNLSFAAEVWNFVEGSGPTGWYATWTKTSGSFPGPVTFDAASWQPSSGATQTYKLTAYMLGQQLFVTRTDTIPTPVNCHYAGTVIDSIYITGTGVCNKPGSKTPDGGAVAWGIMTQ